jgi:hypothetical protein
MVQYNGTYIASGMLLLCFLSPLGTILPKLKAFPSVVAVSTLLASSAARTYAMHISFTFSTQRLLLTIVGGRRLLFHMSPSTDPEVMAICLASNAMVGFCGSA